jgi:hypothetical protein
MAIKDFLNWVTTTIAKNAIKFSNTSYHSTLSSLYIACSYKPIATTGFWSDATGWGLGYEQAVGSQEHWYNTVTSIAFVILNVGSPTDNNGFETRDMQLKNCAVNRYRFDFWKWSFIVYLWQWFVQMLYTLQKYYYRWLQMQRSEKCKSIEKHIH